MAPFCGWSSTASRLESLRRGSLLLISASKKPLFLAKLCGPFLLMGFDCLSAMKPLGGHSLHFTAKPPGVPGTHFINHGRIKSFVNHEATQWF